MTLTAPPHRLQVSMSILNTHRRRWAQVLAAWRCAGVLSSATAWPRRAGVTCCRQRLLRAKTPWKRVKLTRGLGHHGGQAGDEVKRFQDDVGCVVSIRRLELIANIPLWGQGQRLVATTGRAM